MNKQNSLRLLTIIASLVCAGGLAWLGFSWRDKHQQVQSLRQADRLLDKKQYDLAIEAYDRLLATNAAPDYSILINRGYAFLGLNRHRDMLESCSSATSIEPDAALGWNCQGEALYHLQQYQNALEAFNLATEKNPQESTFWLNQARVLSELQQYNKAIAASDRAIKLIESSPNNGANPVNSLAIAFELKGQNLLKLQQYSESLEAFERALKSSPEYLSAQQGKGVALYELGKYREAISVFGQILQRDDLTERQKAMSLLYTGVSLCQIQKNTPAERAFQEVLQLTTDAQSQEIAQKGCGIY